MVSMRFARYRRSTGTPRRVGSATAGWMASALLGLVLAGCQVTPPPDLAEIAASRAQLLQTNACNGCYLRRVSLANADLSGASLIEADLTSANLTRAILFGADLTNASLRRASLDGAIFVNAVLRQAELDDASLRRADLRRAVLVFADFTDADLREADLSRSDLTFANFFGTDLTGANLEDADLFGADFDEATNLTDANLEGVTGLFEGDLDRPIKCRTVMPNGAVDNSGCRSPF